MLGNIEAEEIALPFVLKRRFTHRVSLIASLRLPAEWF